MGTGGGCGGWESWGRVGGGLMLLNGLVDFSMLA